MFTIDGVEWDVPCDITQNPEVKASDISGLMLDGSYFNDVIGTYLSYTVKMAVPFDRVNEFKAIYEIITAPVSGHTMILPYDDGTITINARISGISKIYVRLPNGAIYWKGIQFTATSNAPYKSGIAGEAGSRSFYPPDAGASIGDTYTYTAVGWVPVGDADDTSY